MLFIQNWFNLEVAEEIYGQSLGNHLYQKWMNSENNVTNFLTQLDENNKQLLLDWGAKASAL